MVDQEPWKNAMHMARTAVYFGSIVQVTMSTIGLVFVISFFSNIESRLDIPGHAWAVMYSTVFTTMMMLVSGIIGVATTWSREKICHNAPLVTRVALLKACVEGFLFCYMVPYSVLVGYWICTTTGPAGWVKALKVILTIPSLFFQFGWFMACQKFWQVLQSGHGEDLVLPDSAAHTFTDLSEPLLRDDDDDHDSSDERIFRSASQFGPMGMPSVGNPNGHAADNSGTLPGPPDDPENLGFDDSQVNDGADTATGKSQTVFSQYVAPALSFVGLASSRHADASNPSTSPPLSPSGDPAATAALPVSPDLSPSTLCDVIVCGQPDIPEACSATFSGHSNDKENSADESANAAGSAVPTFTPIPPADDDAVLSPSTTTPSPDMGGLSKVPPLTLPYPAPLSPGEFASMSSADYAGRISTLPLATARPAAPPAADLITPSKPSADAAAYTESQPATAGTVPSSTSRSASARLAAMLASSKLISPMKATPPDSAVTGPVGGTGAPPPSVHSDLSLSGFVDLLKSRRQSQKAAQKLPKSFSGAASQISLWPTRSHPADDSGSGGGSASGTSPDVGKRATSDGQKSVVGTAAAVPPSGQEDRFRATGTGDMTPRWLPGSRNLNTHNFDGSLSSDEEFEDAFSEIAPSSTSSAASVAHRSSAGGMFRRSSEGLSSGGAAATDSAAAGGSALSARVSSVWSKMKARASAGQG